MGWQGWIVQIAGNFPDTDGRMEMGIVKIQLGAFPYHLLA